MPWISVTSIFHGSLLLLRLFFSNGFTMFPFLLLLALQLSAVPATIYSYLPFFFVFSCWDPRRSERWRWCTASIEFVEGRQTVFSSFLDTTPLCLFILLSCSRVTCLTYQDLSFFIAQMMSLASLRRVSSSLLTFSYLFVLFERQMPPSTQ